jgi:hypothetical protein
MRCYYSIREGSTVARPGRHPVLCPQRHQKWRTARAQRAMLCPPGTAQRVAQSAGRHFRLLIPEC